MVSRERIEEIKEKVLIPDYFNKIIIPQMSDYYRDYSVDFDFRALCLCPLHDDTKPSFKYYDYSKTFHCFACEVTGDVITLHRKFTERMTGKYPSFEESVLFLYKHFIEGKEIESNRYIIPVIKEETLSSNEEIVRFNGYINKLERELLVDNSISERAKREIWQAMDLMYNLVHNNCVNAKDAMNYIKRVVSKSYMN